MHGYRMVHHVPIPIFKYRKYRTMLRTKSFFYTYSILYIDALKTQAFTILAYVQLFKWSLPHKLGNQGMSFPRSTSMGNAQDYSASTNMSTLLVSHNTPYPLLKPLSKLIKNISNLSNRFLQVNYYIQWTLMRAKYKKN